MSAVFKGYLLKNVSNGQIFPNKYIEWGSWESNPKQREEVKAYREQNSRLLHRVTATGKKSTIQFKIRSNLHLADIEAIKDWFWSAEINHDERKMQIEFWDDSTLVYRTITVYRANPKFKIIGITDDDLIYDGQTVDLVEY